MRAKWRQLAVLGAALLVAVLGLGAAYALNGGDSETDDVPSAGERAAGASGFWLPVDRLQLPYPRPEFIPEYQWAMIEDGWVTEEEVLAARDATVACIADAGLDVRPLPWEPGSRSAPSYVIRSGSPGAHPAAERCSDASLELVGMAYNFQGDARPWVSADERNQRMRDCLAGHGIHVAAGQTYEEFMTDERFEAMIADPAEAAKHEDCWGRVGGAIRSLGREDGPVTAVAGWQACIAEHGYTVAAPGQHPDEFWTPERLNAIPSVPGLEAVWQKCHVVAMAEALLNAPGRP